MIFDLLPIGATYIIKKPRRINFEVFSFNLAVPTFPVRLQTSILGAMDLTAVFGMGTGVSP